MPFLFTIHWLQPTTALSEVGRGVSWLHVPGVQRQKCMVNILMTILLGKVYDTSQKCSSKPVFVRPLELDSVWEKTKVQQKRIHRQPSFFMSVYFSSASFGYGKSVSYRSSSYYHPTPVDPVCKISVQEFVRHLAESTSCLVYTSIFKLQAYLFETGWICLGSMSHTHG